MEETKKSWERMHARQRAKERFGVNLKNKDLATLVTMIQKGNAEFLRRQSKRVTIWRVRYAEKTMLVVYDTLRHMIVTFLGRRKPDFNNLG